MKNTLVISVIVFIAGMMIFSLVRGESGERWEKIKRHNTGVALVPNPVYQEECGSCHMVYPPGLLPAVSWQKVMSGLEDHFGDNAELDVETQQAITSFLVSNSAEKSDFRRSRRFASATVSSNIVMRITEMPYFKHEHDEIPQRLVAGNKKVNSFSHCNACHRKAEQASFSESDINIPGYGRWDD